MLLTQNPAPAGLLASPLIMFLIAGIAFYFMIMMPQRKQRKEYKERMDNLKVGDNIVTRGGIRGSVTEIKNDSLIIRTGNSEIEILKQALHYIETEERLNNSINNAPVGNLNYGKDEKFINKLEELKAQDIRNNDYDILLNDIYEYIVVEDSAQVESIESKFRLPRERAEKIMIQLEDLGIVSKDLLANKRTILIDPR